MPQDSLNLACHKTHNCWIDNSNNRSENSTQNTPEISNNRLIIERMVSTQLLKARSSVPASKIPLAIFQGLQASDRELAQLDLTAYAPHPRHYAKYLVYNFNEQGSQPFSLTILVFLPGQRTPKHSHRVDCAPICLQGQIEETVYQETQHSQETKQTTWRTPELEVIAKRQYSPYQGGYLYKHQPNTHHLENIGNNIALSLHLYLFNALPDSQGNIASSILRVYP